MITRTAAIFGLLLAIGCQRTSAPVPLQGVIEYDEVDVAFEVGGRVIELPLQRGDEVREGQLVAQLESSAESAGMAARAGDAATVEAERDLIKAGARGEDLRAAQAELDAAKANEAFTLRQWEREKGIAASNMGTATQLDAAESGYLAAQAKRRAVEERLRMLRAGSRKEEVARAENRTTAAKELLEAERRRFDKRTLRSPVSGIVLERHVESGEVVGPGTPVATVADPRRPYAIVFLPQARASELRIGCPAHVWTDSLPGGLEGVVEHVASRTEFTPRYIFSDRERSTLVLRVRIRLNDPQGRVAAGVPAFASFDAAKCAAMRPAPLAAAAPLPQPSASFGSAP